MTADDAKLGAGHGKRLRPAAFDVGGYLRQSGARVGPGVAGLDGFDDVEELLFLLWRGKNGLDAVLSAWAVIQVRQPYSRGRQNAE